LDVGTNVLNFTLGALTMSSFLLPSGSPTLQAQATGATKPNIVIIWGDDIGQSDISPYSRGLMGFKTPNIDRVAAEGMLFTDS
jgi:hypothetical protein